MEDLFLSTFSRLMQAHASPEVVRRALQAGEADALAAQLEESGFGNLLLPEDHGGAGLSLAQIYPLLALLGAHACPVPLAETLVARAALQAAGLAQPAGWLTLAEGVLAEGQVAVHGLPYGRLAGTALVAVGGVLRPLALADAGARAPHLYGLDQTVRWPAACWRAAPVAGEAVDASMWLACLAAARLAGTMATVLDLSREHVTQRVQFGRPLARFQAIQQLISQQAEQMYAAQMAAMIGCQTRSWQPEAARVAIAKATTSAAAAQVAAVGHAVHGAMGFTEEHDLQLFTRLLHRDRWLAGAESRWQEVAGGWLLSSGQPARTLDVIRSVMADTHS